MKIILDKAEVLHIIGKHFDTVLDEKLVTITTEPEFEIVLSGIRMNAEPEAPRSAAPALSSGTPVGATGVGSELTSIEDVLAENAKLLALARSDRNVSAEPPSYSKDEEGEG